MYDNLKVREDKSERSDLSRATYNPAAVAPGAHPGAGQISKNQDRKSNSSNEGNVSLTNTIHDQVNPDAKKDTDNVAPYFRKELLKLVFPLSSEVDFGLHKINTDIISYKLVGNWEELNKGLIEHKIECSVCYSLIFWHESLADRMAPLAYQCTMCQSNLVCGRCAPQLATCPFCRRDDSALEPASSLIINEIKKMKFLCHYSQQDS